MKRIRIGIVGAGAVVEHYHLPAAQRLPEVQVVALVDQNLERAKSVASRFNVPAVFAEYSDLFGRTDGVIVALPHCLHAPVSIEFLHRGIHVLVEKPMALNVAEAEAMIRAAEENHTILQVGMWMRFRPGMLLLKRAIDEDWLGPLRGFSVEYGVPYDWPIASGFAFNKEQAGGGMLIDDGTHALDLLLHYLGDVVHFEYKDDSLGGVEAECEISLVVQRPKEQVRGTIVLSRLRKLQNKFQIIGERFTIEHDLLTIDNVRMWPNCAKGKEVSFILDFPPQAERWSSLDVFIEQLRSFACAISSSGNLTVSGKSVLPTVALIENCYRKRHSLALPWMRSTEALPQEAVTQ